MLVVTSCGTQGAPRLAVKAGLWQMATSTSLPTTNNRHAPSSALLCSLQQQRSCHLQHARRPCVATSGFVQPQRYISLSPPEAVKLRSDPSSDTARRTPTLFNPVYTAEDLHAVKVTHWNPENVGDRVAIALMRVARWGFDVATRYKHPETFPRTKDRQMQKVTPPGYDAKAPSRPAPLAGAATATASPADAASNTSSHAGAAEPDAARAADSVVKSSFSTEPAHFEELTVEEMRKRGISMTPEQWLTRIVFLETIAGVPGLVAAACRHLQSLRVMRRDKGWIRTLLEDAENERMHLLTAMEYAKPGRLMRLAILGAQGVYFNAFFLSYLFFPRVSHRLVGILEEEAVSTYSNIIRDVEEGRLPEWEDLPAPAIAKEYWKMPDSAKMLDVLYAIRADEATHRFINHSLGSLDQRNDYNPFAVQMPPAQLRGTVSGLTPLQAKEWANAAQKQVNEDVKNQSGQHMATPSSQQQSKQQSAH